MLRCVFLAILFTSCSIDRSIDVLSDEESQLFEKYRSLPSINSVQIASKDEPGEQLYICLQLVRKEDKSIILNQEILLYQASASGEYQPTEIGDETTARLGGTVFTNQDGISFIETILPGDYGSSSDTRHIHTTVFNASPEGYDIHFKQYTGTMGKDFIDRSDQHFLAELKRLEDGSLVTFITIEVKNL